MKGNATHLGNVVINDTEAREHKEEYEKMVVNLAGAAGGFYHKNNLK
ncbi:hypothetical protein nimi_97 [Escherichia phage nimi]|jgi:hypothetical protein|uniref:Uncharacterized protein n=3 Tax=Vequintavirus TaxID=1914852 RepID=A0A6B9XFN8_9CAUD|nr:hypothetical protein [Escherichia coli]QHR66476.1 hypothetical protein ime_117 [Escherichia phage ime]QHR73123.1 hypothetical protein nimi_97 [Escherichia phage nimi]QHR75741.1 hypothetical protein nom_176 [Escherichia phage nom]MDI0456527.1 hypothetical protein [Escherichia coli]MDW6467450.1 hypothetical protein [Escherichia coli]